MDLDGPIMPNMSTPCWMWTGTGAKNGDYGYFRMNGRMLMAHRFACDLTGNQLGEMLADHICHNPPCVNPAHLRPTTPKQNVENRLGAQRNNKIGVRGVHKMGNKFRAYVWNKGKHIHLGLFTTIEEAGEVARLKRLELFTHNDADR